MTINKFIGVGRIVKDIELRFTSSGKAAASGTIAINRDYNKEKTDYINFTVWGVSAEKYAVPFGTKGRLTLIEGELNIDKNNDKYYTKINVSKIKFLDKVEKVEGFEDVATDPECPF